MNPTKHSYWQQFANSLWHQNPVFVQLLGLCPLLAVSNNTVNALALGIATLITLLVSNICVSACANNLPAHIRLPAYVTIIASCVTTIELCLAAWLPQLHASLGVFLPLVVTNCIILARAEAYAGRHRVTAAALDGLFVGIGNLLALVSLGALRELLGNGTLFANFEQLLELEQSWTIKISDAQFIIAQLPPGAFFGLAFLLIIFRLINKLIKK